jgi:Antitoxin-like ribbon-helix-helix
VVNNVDKAGEEARIGEATAVMEKFAMAVCPQVVRHRPEFQTAAEKGKAVTASEIRALWDFLDRRARGPTRMPSQSARHGRRSDDQEAGTTGPRRHPSCLGGLHRGQGHSARRRCCQALRAAEPQEPEELHHVDRRSRTQLKELRDLSHETGRKQQELIAEALNMLFVKHGKRRVAR